MPSSPGPPGLVAVDMTAGNDGVPESTGAVAGRHSDPSHPRAGTGAGEAGAERLGAPGHSNRVAPDPPGKLSGRSGGAAAAKYAIGEDKDDDKAKRSEGTGLTRASIKGSRTYKGEYFSRSLSVADRDKPPGPGPPPRRSKTLFSLLGKVRQGRGEDVAGKIKSAMSILGGGDSFTGPRARRGTDASDNSVDSEENGDFPGGSEEVEWKLPHSRRMSDDQRGDLFRQQKQLMEGTQGILEPNNTFFRTWDIIMTGLLLFTCLVTPYEVSFMTVTREHGLYWVNRAVDFFFLVDIAFNFVLPYQDKDGNWVRAPGKIISRYLCTWFLVDLVSICPFDLISQLLSDSDSDSGSNNDLKTLRFLRMLRLIKLLRVVRVGRLFRRWEAQVAIDYMKLELARFILIVVAIAHWLACGWHLVVRFGGEEESRGEFDEPRNWLDHYGYLGEHSSHWALYIASLHWSVATLSTLGYGDIIPVTDWERVYVVLAAILGSSVYAYMVGNVCGLLAAMDQRNAKFYQTMRNLNLFLDDKHLPQWLRVRLREFFRFRRKNSNFSDWQGLMKEMSPALRANVAGFVHRKWVDLAPPLRALNRTCRSAIAMHMYSEAFSAGESIFRQGASGETFFIVERGVVLCGTRILTKGRNFGLEMLMRKEKIKRTFDAATLTHAVTLCVDKQVLLDISEAFPFEGRKLRKFVLKDVFQLAIRQYCSAIRKLQSLEARGFQTHWERRFSPQVLPLVYDHKYRIMFEEDINVMTTITVATHFIQRAMRQFVRRRQRQRQEAEDRHIASLWPHVVKLLRELQLEMYIDVLEAESVTVFGLGNMSPGDLRAVGIPLGKGERIIQKAGEVAAKLEREGVRNFRRRMTLGGEHEKRTSFSHAQTVTVDDPGEGDGEPGGSIEDPPESPQVTPELPSSPITSKKDKFARANRNSFSVLMKSLSGSNRGIERATPGPVSRVERGSPVSNSGDHGQVGRGRARSHGAGQGSHGEDKPY